MNVECMIKICHTKDFHTETRRFIENGRLCRLVTMETDEHQSHHRRVCQEDRRSYMPEGSCPDWREEKCIFQPDGDGYNTFNILKQLKELYYNLGQLKIKIWLKAKNRFSV